MQSTNSTRGQGVQQPVHLAYDLTQDSAVHAGNMQGRDCMQQVIENRFDHLQPQVRSVCVPNVQTGILSQCQNLDNNMFDRLPGAQDALQLTKSSVMAPDIVSATLASVTASQNTATEHLSTTINDQQLVSNVTRAKNSTVSSHRRPHLGEGFKTTTI